MEGPQFSTRAESNLYRNWNVDVIGMTLAPEAKLAREAGMCLCAISAVTDYDCWYEKEEDVNVSSVVENIKRNEVNMANIVKRVIPAVDYKRSCECKDALQHAIITSPDIVRKNSNKEVNKVLLK